MTDEEVLSLIELKDITGKGGFKFVPATYRYKYVLTHQVIRARFYIFMMKGISHAKRPHKLVSLDEISEYPVPRLIEQFLHDKMIIL